MVKNRKSFDVIIITVSYHTKEYEIWYEVYFSIVITELPK